MPVCEMCDVCDGVYSSQQSSCMGFIHAPYSQLGLNFKRLPADTCFETSGGVFLCRSSYSILVLYFTEFDIEARHHWNRETIGP